MAEQGAAGLRAEVVMQSDGHRTSSNRSSAMLVASDGATPEDRQSRLVDALSELVSDLTGLKAPLAALVAGNGSAPLQASMTGNGRASEQPGPYLHSRLLDICIAEIDHLISDQVNAILHHPEFQRLEASWRGLLRIVDASESARDSLENDSSRGGLVIRLLNVSKRDLLKDSRRAIEFDQSVLFHKVYEEEFGIAGGHPYGLLIGDYAFSNTPDDLELLESLAGVAGAAFAPFVAAAAPGLLGIDSFSLLEQPIDFSAEFQRPDFIKWRAFRGQLDSRYVALALPRILMRRPYQTPGAMAIPFCFEENVETADRRNYLWGNAAYAFATVVIRAYATSGWFADIRGVHRGVESGGVVPDLPVHCFRTDPWGVALRMSTEVSIAEIQEKELHKSGLMPICECKDTGLAAFFTNASLYQPRRYDDLVANTNDQMNAMLQYTLCASRFAHYIKVQARQKIGSFASAQEVEDFLHRWIMEYVNPDEHAAPSVKAKYPLRSAEIIVRDVPGRPGDYVLVIRLCPHYQLDQMQGTIQLQARLSTSNP